MPDMTDDELREIEQRLQAATPGPWKHGPESHGVYRPNGNRGEKPIVEEARTPDDANFIAHTPSDIARLLAEVRRLRGELSRIRSELHDARTSWGECRDMLNAARTRAQEDTQ